MPLTTVAIKLSNGEMETLYYPSSAVKEFFQEEQQLKCLEFVQVALEAIKEADRRVVSKYGYPCIGCMILKQKLLKWKQLWEHEFQEETVRIVKIHEFKY